MKSMPATSRRPRSEMKRLQSPSSTVARSRIASTGAFADPHGKLVEAHVRAADAEHDLAERLELAGLHVPVPPPLASPRPIMAQPRSCAAAGAAAAKASAASPAAFNSFIVYPPHKPQAGEPESASARKTICWKMARQAGW